MPTVNSPATLVRRTQSLADAVADHVKRRIASEFLRIGDKLPTESALMEALSVNRTVVREAISRLQAKGLVKTCRGIDSFVLPPRTDNSIPLGNASTMRGILNMLKLRVAIETECAGLAAQRISAAEIEALHLAPEAIEQDQVEGNDSAISDPQFHLSVAHATGNEHFVGVLAQLGKTLIPRARMRLAQAGYLNAPELRAMVNRERHNVFEAIARKDPETACAAICMHLSSSRERLCRAHEAVGTQTTATGSRADQHDGMLYDALSGVQHRSESPALALLIKICIRPLSVT